MMAVGPTLLNRTDNNAQEVVLLSFFFFLVADDGNCEQEDTGQYVLRSKKAAPHKPSAFRS